MGKLPPTHDELINRCQKIALTVNNAKNSGIKDFSLDDLKVYLNKTGYCPKHLNIPTVLKFYNVIEGSEGRYNFIHTKTPINFSLFALKVKSEVIRIKSANESFSSRHKPKKVYKSIADFSRVSDDLLISETKARGYDVFKRL